jgi:hypothetical protein
MPDQSDIQDDDQADPGKSEKQDKPQPIPNRWLDLSTGDVLRGGQEESDLTEPRSGFGHEEFY